MNGPKVESDLPDDSREDSAPETEEEAWVEIGRYTDPTLGKLTLDFLRHSGLAVRVNGASPEAINPYRLQQVTELLVRQADFPRASEALQALENPPYEAKPTTAYRINSVPDEELEHLVSKLDQEREENAQLTRPFWIVVSLMIVAVIVLSFLLDPSGKTLLRLIFARRY